MRPLSFYKKVTRAAEKNMAADWREIDNSIQTNGTLLTATNGWRFSGDNN